MHCHRGLSWAAQALLVVQTLAQFNNWDAHQINTSICMWEQPRAALIRDIVYLDGGDISWLPGLDSGQYGAVTDEGDRGTGTSGAWPNFYDGGMLANDAEFFLYGGLPLRLDGQYAPPDADAVLEYQAYQYGANKPAFQPAFHNLKLSDGVTRYITYGAAVNAPSENKAWYFSGLTSPSLGPIYKNPSANGSTRASNISSTLITLDMSTQLSEKWSNTTLPGTVRGRANAEVVWVPVGKQGILVVLGGVTYPEWINSSRKSQNETGSEQLDPEYMSVIDIYDIANNKWYKQPAKNGGPGTIPSARTRGCAVVAPASDFSSFNIYYYGGYDGLHPVDPFYDEVWVLSLPSFTWTRINKGTTVHARSGHKCFTPYPDQMMVFGGNTPNRTCLDKGPVVVFNLTSGVWMESYDPTKYSNYGIPEGIQAIIGGSASGGATVTKPLPSGWAIDALGTVFATQYDRKKITKYWPYAPAAVSTDRPTLPKPHHGDSGLPSWARPVLGVVTALVVITCLSVLYFLWRRRRMLRRQSTTPSTEYRSSRMISWIRGKPMTEKASPSTPSVVSPVSPEGRDAPVFSYISATTDSVAGRYEMPDTPIVELDATNTRSELQDTGLTRPEIHQRYSHWLQARHGQPPSPSEVSFSISGFPLSANPSVHRGVGDGTPRVDSPPLGASFPVAGVSRPPPVPELEEGDIRPLFHGKQSSTPTEADEDRSPDVVSPVDPRGSESIISPPTEDEVPGEDYLATKKGPSPNLSTSSSNQSMRHIVFQMKDKKRSIDNLQSERGHDSGV
ncbi:Kelch repeat-containing protein [Cladobotryum mycophilum]|uniref:Kelch repeat-containing protein n=1 Tax=Cladobotryum mycophilum TaxID=491253 RepID=A0ABR0S707_9HYPO